MSKVWRTPLPWNTYKTGPKKRCSSPFPLFLARARANTICDRKNRLPKRGHIAAIARLAHESSVFRNTPSGTLLWFQEECGRKHRRAAHLRPGMSLRVNIILYKFWCITTGTPDQGHRPTRRWCCALEPSSYKTRFSNPYIFSMSDYVVANGRSSHSPVRVPLMLVVSECGNSVWVSQMAYIVWRCRNDASWIKCS